MHYLYHIHREGMLDLTEGYIGISNNPEKRWHSHKTKPKNKHLENAFAKYDDIVFTIINSGDEDYILSEESRLRSEPNIGWNIAPGGGKPPTYSGKDHHAFGKPAKNRGMPHTPEVLAKMISNHPKGMLGKTHTIETKHKFSENRKGSGNSMFGRTHSDDAKRKMSESARGRQDVTCPHCNKSGKAGSAMSRWHFDNCRSK